MDYYKFTPRKSLNKVYLKIKVGRNDIEKFKKNLNCLLDRIDEDKKEDYHKDLVSDFLKSTYYWPNHFVGIKDNIDLVIHTKSNPGSSVGVIIEAKKPANKAEMVKPDNLNTKAFQELVLYYLRERITAKNLDIKHLIVTNIYEWYVFDAKVFNELFAENKDLVRQFVGFEEKRLTGYKTEFFYKNIAAPAIEAAKQQIPYTHFDIRDYDKPLRNASKDDDNTLIALYKLLSPEHLLKLPFANDSNSLDKTFYAELLHVMGLTEVKVGGKKLIQRKEEGERDAGSLVESAIFQLDNLDIISRLNKPTHYGTSNEEQLFAVSLDLAITWINRILFLKLLEAQLLKYQKGDKAFAFLNAEKVKNFDDLNNLFFSVLARKPHERDAEVGSLFANVPYLNSSLFEPTELEHSCLFISQLKDGALPLLSSTVIKDNTGKRSTGSQPTLEYLFNFLDAYDFTSEGSEAVQEENKNLINASVLGLIFEKINGYKDGSFFTPGFITMYMCRETIRRAVVQKFNDTKTWNCTDFSELYDKIGEKKEDRIEANAIVNSLKICDPAVGSGHFLVSALNEIIAIKSDLRILLDNEGKRLKEYAVVVENDELCVYDEDNEPFEYNPKSAESRRVQETLFHEKQTIIENCLFGVDLNPNSVKICRLRLWIELLKNAYYKAPDFTELETLPNIDINIKCGNSLISRYGLDTSIKTALRNSKWTIESYRLAVMTYRNAKTKDEKRAMERLILSIKQDFTSEIRHTDPLKSRMDKLANELYNKFTGNFLFEPEVPYGNNAKDAGKKKEKEREKLEKEIAELTAKMNEMRDGTIYENAFEWRFEFPEVLNDDGDFVGFDVVIGNPPYIRIQDLTTAYSSAVDYYGKKYATTGEGNYDLYVPFVEKGVLLLNSKGNMSYIMPHKFINANYGKLLRKYISENQLLYKLLHFGAHQVFDDAATYTGLFFITKSTNSTVEYTSVEDFESFKKGFIPGFVTSPSNLLSSDKWIFLNTRESMLFNKLLGCKDTLETKTTRIFQGVKTSADKIFIVHKLDERDSYYHIKCEENGREYQLEKGLLFPLVKGGNSRAYALQTDNLLLLFPYIDGMLVEAQVFARKFPRTWSYLQDHKAQLESREHNLFNGNNWYAFGRSQAINLICKKKIFTPDIAPSPRFSCDEKAEYVFTSGVSGGYGIVPENDDDFKLLLALLNSKVASWFITKTSTQMRGGWYSFESRFIKNIPVPIICQTEKNRIEKVVSKITKIKKDDFVADTSALEAEIDQLVYQLYGLSEEEIKIVEGA